MKMKIIGLIISSTILWHAHGQLTPQQAAVQMTRGINIGNTMDAPDGENTWGNIPVQERAFADYKNAGFTAIRIPITWDKRTSTSSPYAVTKTWMDRVEQVVDWGLKQKLIIIINVHHDGWIKTDYTPTNVARFDSIWSQIATRFKNKSDSLIFEIINEPRPITQANLDDLNRRTLKTIRKTNPTRIVVFAGKEWSGAADLLNSTVPSLTDPYLLAYYHSYDPYPFGLVGTGTYGTDADLQATKKQFDDVANWSVSKNIPIYLGEFGSMKKCEYNSRMACYAYVVYQALAHGIPSFAWDDNGDFPVYNRLTGGFNEIKDILIYTQLESPYKLSYTVVSSKNIKLSWVNRMLTDSIVVERSINSASNFTSIAKIAPTAQQFTDITTSGGNSYYYRLRTSVPGKIVMSYPIKTAIVCLPAPITPYLKKASEASLHRDSVADLRTSESVTLSPQTTSTGGTWKWSGPNSFTASSREITLLNVQTNRAGNYTATYTAVAGCPNTRTFTISVCNPVPIVPYLKVTGASMVQDSVAAVKSGGSIKLSPQPTSGGTWLWTGPNSYTSNYNEVIIANFQEADAGEYQLNFKVSPACISKCTYVLKLEKPSAIPSSLKDKRIDIFPNPSNGYLEVQGCNQGLLQIFDMTGKLVFKKNIEGFSEFNTNLVKGIYTIKLTAHQFTLIDKLLIN
jgi:hypothetical protein